VQTALAEEQTTALGLIAEIEHPLAGIVRSIAPAFTMSLTPPTVRRAPPTLGQHTAEVVASLRHDPASVWASPRAGEGE